MTTQNAADRRSDRHIEASGRARLLIGPVTLAAGALTAATLLVVTPWGERNELDYADLAPIRGDLWTGILLDGVAFAAVATGLSLVVCGLARARGATVANVGAVVAWLGGVLFAMGAFAIASLAYFATDTSLLSAQQGTAFLDEVVDEGTRGTAVQMAGFGLFTIGVLVLSAALIRARTVNRVVPIAILVLTFAQFATEGRVLDYVQIALMLFFVLLAGTHARTVTQAR